MSSIFIMQQIFSILQTLPQTQSAIHQTSNVKIKMQHIILSHIELSAGLSQYSNVHTPNIQTTCRY